MVQYSQINKCNKSHKQNERKNHIILSIEVEKSPKVPHTFMIKTESTGSIPQYNKCHIQETYSKHHTQWKKINIFH